MIFGEVCDCNCHDSIGEVKHIMPCCSTCPHCHKRIIFSAITSHEPKCHDMHDPVISNGVRLNAIIEAIMVLQKAGLNTSSTSMHLSELISAHTSGKDPD